METMARRKTEGETGAKLAREARITSSAVPSCEQLVLGSGAAKLCPSPTFGRDHVPEWHVEEDGDAERVREGGAGVVGVESTQ